MCHIFPHDMQNKNRKFTFGLDKHLALILTRLEQSAQNNINTNRDDNQIDGNPHNDVDQIHKTKFDWSKFSSA